MPNRQSDWLPLQDDSRTAANPEQLAISAPTRIDARVCEPVDLACALSRRGERADRPVTVAAKRPAGRSG